MLTAFVNTFYMLRLRRSRDQRFGRGPDEE
jgi:hypothetical protein